MKYIRVYNSGAPIVLSGSNTQYVVERGTYDEPATEDIPEDDVYYIAGKTNVFKTGRLFFADDEVDSIMDFLRIPNWRDTVITDAEIRDTILHPNYDKVLKIIKINSSDTAERYRAMLIGMENDGNIGVPDKIAKIIKERCRELSNGHIDTQITVTKDSFVEEHNSAKDDENAMLKKQLAEMQAKLEALEKAQAPAMEAPAKKTASKKTTTK